MFERYFTRTLEHIHRVQKCMVNLIVNYKDELGVNREECRMLMHNVTAHDQSKFSEEQFEPYIELTEFYHQKKVLKNEDYDYPEGMKEKVDKAVDAHYYSENHHPERIKHDLQFNFGMLEAIETVCDLQAMAQEFNEGTCRKFFEEIWVPKHANHWLSPEQAGYAMEYMDRVIKCVEDGHEKGLF